MRTISSLRHVLVKAGAGPPPAVSFIQTVASERCNKYHTDRQHSSKMASTGSAPFFLRLVSNSVCVAHRAGRLIRDILSKGELGIIEKGWNDLQTEADRSAQRCIVGSLRKQFADVTIIGEEGEMDPNDVVSPDWIEMNLSEDVLSHSDKLPQQLKDATADQITVWVDPLDGTAEFTQGLLDHVTVLIGVAVQGKAVGGVVYQPYHNYQAGPGATLGRAIWGIVGVGAFGFESTKPPEGQNIITTTRSHGTRAVVEAVDACQPTEVLRVGGAGHKVLLIIEGKAHAYVFASPGCKKWDTCAPEAVLHAMGGKLTDIHGNTFQYHPGVKHKNTGGVLATPQVPEHEWYLNKIPDSVKETLPPS